MSSHRRRTTARLGRVSLAGIALLTVVGCSDDRESVVTPDRRIAWTAGPTPLVTPTTSLEVGAPMWERMVNARVVRLEGDLRIITGEGLDETGAPSGARGAAIVRGDDQVLASGAITDMEPNLRIAMFASVGTGGIVSALPRDTTSVRLFSDTGVIEIAPEIDPVTGARFVAVAAADVHGLHALDANGAVLAVVQAA